jgi:hypothetical protein
LLDDIADLRDLVNTHEGVHLRQELGQFVAKPLWETAGDDQTLTPVLRLAQCRRFQNRINALLLRRINERAGVHDHHVRLGSVAGDLDAVLQQRADHHLGIHEVLRAA